MPLGIRTTGGPQYVSGSVDREPRGLCVGDRWMSAGRFLVGQREKAASRTLVIKSFRHHTFNRNSVRLIFFVQQFLQVLPLESCIFSQKEKNERKKTSFGIHSNVSDVISVQLAKDNSDRRRCDRCLALPLVSAYENTNLGKHCASICVTYWRMS